MEDCFTIASDPSKPRLLRVADLDDAGVFLRMPDALAALPPAANDLVWSILDLGEVVVDDASPIDVEQLERRVLASPSGLTTSLHELADFAMNTRQVIDGLFVGCADRARLPRRDAPDTEILGTAEITLAAFDSTFWLISGPDDVLERVHARFNDVTEEDPAQTPLRAS